MAGSSLTHAPVEGKRMIIAYWARLHTHTTFE